MTKLFCVLYQRPVIVLVNCIYICIHNHYFSTSLLGKNWNMKRIIKNVNCYLWEVLCIWSWWLLQHIFWTWLEIRLILAMGCKRRLLQMVLLLMLVINKFFTYYFYKPLSVVIKIISSCMAFHCFHKKKVSPRSCKQYCINICKYIISLIHFQDFQKSKLS